MNRRQMIELWQAHYSGDQENLYANPLVRIMFDPGHRFIAAHSRQLRGVVLDVGSGMGYHLKFEQLPPWRTYINTDANRAMLERITHPAVHKAAATCGQLPFSDSSVDVIIASHILEHLPQLRTDLYELHRVLKPDGTLLVVLPCDPGWLWRTLAAISPSRRRLRQLGIDYDVVMRHEHVNPYATCLQALQGEFSIASQAFYPALIPNHNLNVLHCLALSHKQPPPRH